MTVQELYDKLCEFNDERAFNKYLINCLMDGLISPIDYLEYLEMTQSDVAYCLEENLA